jgi:hypothetical protein
MFEVAGLEGKHDILQYVKPNALAKDLQLMMELTTNSYPNQCIKVPNLEFQFLAGHIHLFASAATSTRAVKQCVNF